MSKPKPVKQKLELTKSQRRKLETIRIRAIEDANWMDSVLQQLGGIASCALCGARPHECNRKHSRTCPINRADCLANSLFDALGLE